MKKFTKLFLTFALLFGVMGGVNSVKAEVKTDLLLLKNGAINTDNFDITPIGTSTLTTENLYAATFTTKGDAGYYNTFQYKDLDVSKYDKVVIKYTIEEGNTAWQINLPSGSFTELPKGSNQEYEISLKDVDSYGDFTIFSWNHTGKSITISEVYLYTDKWEIQQQQQTVYNYALGDALNLSDIVSNSTLVSLASGSDILYGKADDGSQYGSNQIKLAAFDDVIDLISGDDNTSYQFRIFEATDEGLYLPSGISTLYRIKAFKADGTTPFVGPSWNGSSSFFLQEIDWTYNVADGTDEKQASFFAITPVDGKTNTYTISAYKKDGTAGYKTNIYNKSEWLFKVVAQTPQQVNVDVWVEVQGADPVDPGVVAVPDGYISIIKGNGTFSDDNVESFFVKEKGATSSATVTADAGRAGGKGIKATSFAEASNAWDSQFWVKFDDVVPNGVAIHVEFDYRASAPTTITSQQQTGAFQYKGGGLNNLSATVNWKHFSQDFTISQDDVQAIAFNLNETKDAAIDFFFDNFVVYTEDDPLKAEKLALQNAIDKGKLQNSFGKTTASFAALTTAISDAETELANASATAKSLTDAATAINDAINGFVLLDGYTNLTTDMFKAWNDNNKPTTPSDASCTYVLNVSTDKIYGDADNVYYKNFADISDFSKLYVLINAGTARVQMNRETDEGTTHIAYRDAAVSEVDFATEMAAGGVLEGFDFVHLNAIKDNWGKVTVNGMLLYRTITVGEAGYATFGSLSKNAKLNDVTGYAAVYNSSTKTVTLTEVTNVPAGKGVIIEAAAGSYAPTFDVAASDITSDLKVSNGTVKGDGSTIYVLNKVGGNVGFYLLKENNKLEAGKAYLEIPGGIGAREFITIEGLETSGIKETVAKTANHQYFDLQGRRIEQPTRGLYIVNGKKTLVK